MFDVAPSQWVVSRRFDLMFFLCPVFLGILYFLSLNLAPQHALLITAIVWVVFAQTHFGSTWFIYFDKRNREYYAQHPLIYYVLPVLVFCACVAIGYVNATLLVILTSIVSIYHVTQQNLGILQLYRVRNKEFSQQERKIERITVYAWTLFFGGYGALRLPDFRALFEPILPLAQAGIWTLLLVAVAGSVMVLKQHVGRKEKASLPKNIFLLTSILMYSPYLYASIILVNIYQMEIATLTSLIAHYMQYIGLVWLINVNKYGSDTEFARENTFMRILSRNYGYIVGAIAAYALLMAYLRWGVPTQSAFLARITPNIVLGLIAVHFYIDSFIWKFRNPFVKETVAPFIKPVAEAVPVTV
jgi:hypothetical protein